MGTTANIGLHLLAENQGGAEIVFNESMYRVDALIGLSVISSVVTNPSLLTPTTGDVYLVGASATGVWEGLDNYVAYYITNQWKFVQPIEGMRAWNQAENKYKYYEGSSWEDLYGTKDEISGHISVPVEKDYCLVLVSAKALTINKLSAVLGEGTCTLGLSVAGVAPETTLAVAQTLVHLEDFDSDLGDQTLAVAANTKLELVVSSVGVDTFDLQFSIETETTL